MKTCPFCAEEIQDAAIVCRYCHRDLVPPKPKSYRYLTLIFHWRNMDESGWVNAENTSADQAAQHFWNTVHQLVSGIDSQMTSIGWEIVEPRAPGCIKVESIKNAKGNDPVASTVAAILTGGGSLIGQALGFYKWWASSCTLRWRRSAETISEETVNMWINPENNNEFERMEKDPQDSKWYLWRRPADYDENNPDDDRWDRIDVSTYTVQESKRIGTSPKSQAPEIEYYSRRGVKVTSKELVVPPNTWSITSLQPVTVKKIGSKFTIRLLDSRGHELHVLESDSEERSQLIVEAINKALKGQH